MNNLLEQIKRIIEEGYDPLPYMENELKFVTEWDESLQAVFKAFFVYAGQSTPLANKPEFTAVLTVLTLSVADWLDELEMDLDTQEPLDLSAWQIKAFIKRVANSELKSALEELHWSMAYYEASYALAEAEAILVEDLGVPQSNFIDLSRANRRYGRL